MAKKINSIVKKIPSGEIVSLTFKKSKDEIYIVTKTRDNSGYYLYEKVAGGYKYLKSRKKDPLFQETNPEEYE